MADDSERRVVVPAQGGKLYPYPKGVSGNPGGKPRGLASHRAKLRRIADALAQRLETELMDLPAKDLDAMVRALDTISDRGGYLGGDKLLALEASVWRTAIAASAAEHLTADQRDGIIDGMEARKAEVLGDAEDDSE